MKRNMIYKIFCVLGVSAGMQLPAQNASEYSNNVPVAGNNNAAFGANALNNNTSGARNTAIGHNALYTAPDQNQNTGIGKDVLYNNTSVDNTAAGYRACFSKTGGHGNTAAGSEALFNCTGDYNSALGYQALYVNTSENDNTAIGSYADITPGGSNQTAIGSGAICLGANRVRVGDANLKTVEGNVVAVSDGRFKENITRGGVPGMAFIGRLEPVTYEFDVKKYAAHIAGNVPAERRHLYVDESRLQNDGLRHTGLLAQDVQAAAVNCGFDFDAIKKPVGAYDTYGLGYAAFVVPLVKAVQEQQNKIVELQSKLSKTESGVFKGDLESDRKGDWWLAVAHNGSSDGKSIQIAFQTANNAQRAYIAVINAKGEFHATYPVDGFSVSALTLDVTSLKPGSYFICLVAEGKIKAHNKTVISE